MAKQKNNTLVEDGYTQLFTNTVISVMVEDNVYEVKDGCIVVPNELVEHLLANGFTNG